MKLAIKIATYYKKDGSTSKNLERALESIKNQSYQDYFVYLIGDDYKNLDELRKISSIIDSKKIKLHNLPVAVEREKYSGKELWVCGGCNAFNVGIELAQKDNLNYICHLDHDDYWLPNHLEEISNAIKKTKSNFVCTLSKTPIKVLPEIKSNLHYVNYIPQASKLIHSSTCINFSYFRMKYRNMIAECKKIYPSDADLWNRIEKFYIQKKEHGILINLKTTIKTDGMVVIKNPSII